MSEDGIRYCPKCKVTTLPLLSNGQCGFCDKWLGDPEILKLGYVPAKRAA